MDKEQQLSPEQRHKIWMKNSGYLYDRLMIQKLKWPSLTFQWLPYVEQGKQSVKYRFCYGSHSSGQQSIEHLYVGQVQFPHLKNINQQPGMPVGSKMKNICRFNHQLQINKARYSEANNNHFACRGDDSAIVFFQMGKEEPIHVSDQEMGQGFALQWKKQGLISSDFNGDLRIWKDVEKPAEKYHYDCSIQDNKWVNQDIIVTVSDDGFMNFWDLREKKIVNSILTTQDDKKQVYTVAVNPLNNNILITGGQDKVIKIWDTRNLNEKLYKFDDHQDSIVTLDWSPFKPNIFASGSLDHKVKIWDLMRVGFEIPKDLGGTDQLLFTHQGHQGAVNDLSWNHHAMLLGSCEEEKNTVQFYQISNYIHQFEYAEDVDFLRQNCFQ